MRKKLVIALISLLIGFPLFADNSEGNPFKKFGYHVEVGTFGDGEEFHDGKEVVEIGLVLYNTKTNEVVGFVGERDVRIELPKDIISTSIDPHCERYYSISPYAYCFNNPVRFIDPDGRDVWEMDHSGNINWVEKSKKHRLYSLDADGNRTNNYVQVKDKSILQGLEAPEGAKKGDASSVTVGKESVNDLFKVFKFAADNTNSEWVVYKYDNNNSTNYTLGTIRDEVNAGSYDTYGISVIPDAKVHSHPNIATDRASELSSMGVNSQTGNPIATRSDWRNVINDIKRNGTQRTLSYVYFQNTTNLYHISGNGPAFIRKIRNDSNRFFFGTF